jgi:dihydropteroate synthase
METFQTRQERRSTGSSRNELPVSQELAGQILRRDGGAGHGFRGCFSLVSAYTSPVAEVFQWDTTRALVMGVLNVTPDSFSDGGKFLDVERAVAHGKAMAEAGADIIDVGGESTRPGSQPVNAEEEFRRVLPVVERLSVECGASTLSVDTTKAAVAERALAAGAQIVNDISALRFDPRMVAVVREHGAGVVLMHMQGTPEAMQENPRYADVLGEVMGFLRARIAFALDRGIRREQIAIDPGIGFGKSVEHNLVLLARLDEFQTLGCAVLVGPSRKSFIGKLLNRQPEERIWGTAAAVAWAIAQGVHVVRVHDVAEAVDVVRMVEAIRSAR